MSHVENKLYRSKGESTFVENLKRSTENPEFAELCKLVTDTVKRFDNCKEEFDKAIEKRIAEVDNIPDKNIYKAIKIDEAHDAAYDIMEYETEKGRYDDKIKILNGIRSVCYYHEKAAMQLKYPEKSMNEITLRAGHVVHESARYILSQDHIRSVYKEFCKNKDNAGPDFWEDFDKIADKFKNVFIEKGYFKGFFG